MRQAKLFRQAKIKLAGGKSRRQELIVWQDDRELAEIGELIPGWREHVRNKL